MGKIENKATILTKEGEIRRNVYACYLDGFTLYVRYRGHVHQVSRLGEGFKLGRMIA